VSNKIELRWHYQFEYKYTLCVESDWSASARWNKGKSTLLRYARANDGHR